MLSSLQVVQQPVRIIHQHTHMSIETTPSTASFNLNHATHLTDFSSMASRSWAWAEQKTKRTQNDLLLTTVAAGRHRKYMVVYFLQLERRAREQAKAKWARVRVKPRQSVVYVFAVVVQRSLCGQVIVWAALMKSALQLVSLRVARPQTIRWMLRFSASSHYRAHNLNCTLRLMSQETSIPVWHGYSSGS
jgi:hypothetical protein